MATASTSTATATATKLQPYLFLYGRAEEALKFYKDIFGGSFEIMRVKDTPMVKEWPNAADRVMHASFTAPNISFFASDGQDSKAVDPDAGNVSLGLTVGDAAEADRIFKALAQGGKVTMQMEPAFWGGRFGTVQDRFGTEWLITAP